jgi:hypothetical protein
MASEAQALQQTPALSSGKRVVPMGLVGLGGGIVGALVAEVVQYEGGDETRFFAENLEISSGIWFMLGLLGVGVALVLSQGLIEKNLEKSGAQLAIGLPAILVGGFLSGVIGQSIYTALYEQQRVARVVGWAIAGGLAGVSVGLASRSMRRVLNGGLGGLGGGMLAGLLFDPISSAIASDSASDSAVVARFIGFALIGFLMGVLIALIDVATTSFFLELASTELAGRQFILFDQTSIVGCARTVAVTLTKDPLVREQHVRITKTSGGLAFECLAGAPPVLVNGQQVTQGVLGAGSFIQIGNTLLRVGQRKQTGTAIASPGATPHAPVAGDQGQQLSGYGAVPRPGASGPVTQPPRPRPTIPMKPKR